MYRYEDQDALQSAQPQAHAKDSPTGFLRLHLVQLLQDLENVRQRRRGKVFFDLSAIEVKMHLKRVEQPYDRLVLPDHLRPQH